MRLANRPTPMIVAGVVLIAGLAGQAAKRPTMPSDTVMNAVQELLPDGRVEEIEFERRIVRMYDITVVTPDRVLEVSVMEDGTVLNTEQEIGADELPEAAALELGEMPGKLTEVERVVRYAELRAVPLDVPRTEFEVELDVQGKDRLVRLSESGEVLQGNPEGPDRDD